MADMDVFRLGPLLLSGERLAAVGALWLFLAAAGLLDRWSPQSLLTAAWRALIIGLVVARIGYVATHWDAYRVEPAAVLSIWQGGFSLVWGLVGAALYLAASLRSLRAIALAGAAGGIALGAWFGVGALLPSQQAVAPLPKITAMRLDGTPITNVSRAGRPLVINLWATWCGPCRREMPMLMQEASVRSDVTFLLLNQGEAAEVVRRYLEDSGLRSTHIALDPGGETGRKVGASGLPMTIFVSADGLVRRTHTGEIARAALHDGLDALATDK